MLAKSDAAWERIRQLVKPANDAEFAAIKAYYRAGIPPPWTGAETRSAEKLTQAARRAPATPSSWAVTRGSIRSSSMLQAVKAPARRASGWGASAGRWSRLLALVALWELAALIAASRYLPGPLAVVRGHGARGARPASCGATSAPRCSRVAFSFVVAMFIGSAIGIALGRYPRADRFFDTWLIFFLNLPALVIIVLCYIWFGLTEVGGDHGGRHQQDPQRRRDHARGRAQPVARISTRWRRSTASAGGRRCAT